MTSLEALTAGARDRLAALIRERSFREGDFVLASGRRSRLYFNLKPTIMTAEGALLAAALLHDALAAEEARFAGGLEMGAVPIIGAIAAISRLRGRPVDGFFVRKAAKAHGAGLRLEGAAEGELAGRRAVVVDDVATSGGSLLQAVETVREARAQVDAALVLVDREEGAAELLSARGVRLRSIFTARDFTG